MSASACAPPDGMKAMPGKERAFSAGRGLVHGAGRRVKFIAGPLGGRAGYRPAKRFLHEILNEARSWGDRDGGERAGTGGDVSCAAAAGGGRGVADVAAQCGCGGGAFRGGRGAGGAADAVEPLAA